MPDEDRTTKVLRNGVKVVGETLVPGASLLIDEKLKPGLLHVGAGLLAKAVIGVPGFALVAANSLCTSLTGKNLVAFLKDAALTGVHDLHEEKLADKVARDVEKGLTYEEIRADVLEDVEDLYREATAKSQTKQSSQTKQAG